MMQPRDTTSARRIGSLIDEVMRDEEARSALAQRRWKHLFESERDTDVDLQPMEETATSTR